MLWYYAVLYFVPYDGVVHGIQFKIIAVNISNNYSHMKQIVIIRFYQEQCLQSYLQKNKHVYIFCYRSDEFVEVNFLQQNYFRLSRCVNYAQVTKSCNFTIHASSVTDSRKLWTSILPMQLNQVLTNMRIQLVRTCKVKTSEKVITMVWYEFVVGLTCVLIQVFEQLISFRVKIDLTQSVKFNYLE